LICGAPQTGFTAGRTLGKRKLPGADTVARDEVIQHTLGKRKRETGATASDAASQGALAEARASADPAIYDQYVGRYLVSALDGGNFMTVSREGNRLYVVWDNKKSELIPQSETDFSLQSTETIIRFNKNNEGRVVSLSAMSPVAELSPQYWREGEQPAYSQQPSKEPRTAFF
jgi:Domain of unknown function (DUF3471)